VESHAGPQTRITLADALRAYKRAVDERAFDRARAMTWRLLTAGTIDLSVLIQLAEHLYGIGEIRLSDKFARIASVTDPTRFRAYLLVLRASEVASRTEGHRVGGWVFACDPSNSEAPARAGYLARLGGDGQAALIHFQRSLILRPWSAATWTGAGTQLRELGNESGSREALRRAACLSPASAAVWFASAGSASAVFDHEDTVEKYGRVLVIDPGHHVAHENRGHGLRRRGQFSYAINAYRRSLLLDPARPDALIPLAQMAIADRDISTVRQFFDRARAAGPEHPEAQFFGALTDLRVGRFEAGWEGYFWFLKLDFPRLPRRQRLPRWPDEELNPTGVLVWNDQFGIGEEVMYLGAIVQLAERVDRLVISCSAKLEGLVQRSFPRLDVSSAELVATSDPDLGDRPSEISLIGAISSIRRSFADFPRHQGYLVADPVRVAAFRDRYLDPSGRPLVGISWSSPLGFQGPRKSVPLLDWGPIFRALPARFVSLQYNASPDEIIEAREHHGVDILVDPDLDSFADLDGHAAQIAAMDRVVSISSIAAHLAGALGKPVDMIYPNEIALLWYWFHDRDDSPWYPSMTIHRPARGQDREAFMTALARRLGQRTPAGAAPG
jgi:tetratricopeptide (TPR) repeat protein